MKPIIRINNEDDFYYFPILPDWMITGKEKLYIFRGTGWLQLSREPMDDELHEFKIDDGILFHASPIEARKIKCDGPARYIFWNKSWYELLPDKKEVDKLLGILKTKS